MEKSKDFQLVAADSCDAIQNQLLCIEAAVFDSPRR
jgi:hypothetical protein